MSNGRFLDCEAFLDFIGKAGVDSMRFRELTQKTVRFSGWELSALNILKFQIRRLPRSREDNFDLSIILPFYKKLEEFRRVLPHNAPYFERNGIEVLIVLDEPSEQAGLIELLKSHPFINWRVIVNDVAHPWRNPAKVINVGIRHAQRSKVLVMSPESLLQSDAIKLLAEYVAANPRHFATGIVRFEHRQEGWIAAGSICASRRALEEVGGYDESYTEWGADDDDLRVRLRRAGYKGRQLLSARLLHTELKPRMKKFCSPASRKLLDQTLAGSRITVNGESWGREFSHIALDYRQNIHAPELCRNYLGTLAAHEIPENAIFRRRHGVVALIQCHQNPDINDCLEHVSRFVDGIVLLDDGSADLTYEIAAHPKLLIKAKKFRQGFDDLQNRNILLNIASFIPSDWLFFIDTDERIDERFQTPHQATTPNADVIRFNLVHLWNDPKLYRADYPYSRNGLVSLYRMFRNHGRTQIKSDKKLHFKAVPISSEKDVLGKVVLLHHGHLEPEKRRRKFQFYTEQDRNKDQASYRHFLDEKVVLKSVADLRLD